MCFYLISIWYAKKCGNIIRYVETNCKSQRQSARDVAFFGRYASCPQLVRCEARNVGPGTLVQCITYHWTELGWIWVIILYRSSCIDSFQQSAALLRLFLMERPAGWCSFLFLEAMNGRWPWSFRHEVLLSLGLFSDGGWTLGRSLAKLLCESV